MKQAGKCGRNQSNRSLPFVWISALPPDEKPKAVKQILKKAKKEKITTGWVSIEFRSRKFGDVTTVGEFQRPDRLVCPKESAENLLPRPKYRQTVIRKAFSNAT